MILTGNSEDETAVSTYWKYEKWVRMNVSILHSFPGATGCIYAMRRKLATPIPAELLVDDVYQPLHAYFRGYRVCFEPGARAYDYPTSLSVEFHRKVRTLAGIYQIIGYLPRLLLPTHGMWIHFLSHKFSRLLLPYALIATAVTSFWLPYPWCVWAVAAQGTFYTLALLNRWIPAEATIKRITAPIETFVVLILAAACATSILFISNRRFWKATQVQVTPHAAGPADRKRLRDRNGASVDCRYGPAKKNNFVHLILPIHLPKKEPGSGPTEPSGNRLRGNGGTSNPNPLCHLAQSLCREHSRGSIIQHLPKFF